MSSRLVVFEGVEGQVDEDSFDDSRVDGHVQAAVLTRTDLHLSQVGREGEVCGRMLQQSRD